MSMGDRVQDGVDGQAEVQDASTVGDNVRRLRLAAGLSQRTLSRNAGIHYQTLSNIERGVSSPDLKTTSALAQALNVPLEILLSTTTHEVPSPSMSRPPSNLSKRRHGGNIARALRRHGLSMAEAAQVMGYEQPDMLHLVLSDVVDPSLDELQRLADHVNEPIGDLLPNSGANPVSDEFRDVLAVLSGVSGAMREEIIAALAVNARMLVNMLHRLGTDTRKPPLWTERSGKDTSAVGTEVGFKPTDIERIIKGLAGRAQFPQNSIDTLQNTIDTLLIAFNRTPMLALTDNPQNPSRK
jgi:transcriptional regulator with XRE-family HTH domain